MPFTASKQIVYAYSPYGEATTLGPDGGNSLQYTGRENDGAGLYYYRARYYDPVLKQFVSEDPIGLEAGPNFYAYVNGNPASYSDPEGLAPPMRTQQRPSTREMARHPELIQYPPAFRENAGVRDVFMEHAKGGSDFLKGYRESVMGPWLREQGIDSPNRRLPLPPISSDCIYICRPGYSDSCGVGPDCIAWCGPKVSAP